MAIFNRCAKVNTASHGTGVGAVLTGAVDGGGGNRQVLNGALHLAEQAVEAGLIFGVCGNIQAADGMSAAVKGAGKGINTVQISVAHGRPCLAAQVDVCGQNVVSIPVSLILRIDQLRHLPEVFSGRNLIGIRCGAVAAERSLRFGLIITCRFDAAVAAAGQQQREEQDADDPFFHFIFLHKFALCQIVYTQYSKDYGWNFSMVIAFFMMASASSAVLTLSKSK